MTTFTELTRKLTGILVCPIIGHRYSKVADFGSQTCMVACCRCRTRWLMNHPTRSLIVWDNDCEELAHISMEAWP